MFKKIISAAAALVISASAVAGGLMNNTANALDLGGFLEEEMEKSKFITLSRGNIVNFSCTDSNGAVMDNYSARIRNSAGQIVGIFMKSYKGGNEDFYKDNTMVSSITDNIEWEVPMKTFGDLVSPQVPVMACDYVVNTSPASSISYGVYEKYDPNVKVVLSGKYESSECEQMKILATNAGETTAFTIPANKAGIFVDSKWSSRDGEGYYYVGDGSNKYFSEKDMIGKLKVISPKNPISELGIGVDSKVGLCSSLLNNLEYQSTTTEYVKWTMNLKDIFTESDNPQFRDDGTFLYESFVCDPKKDRKNTSTVVVISSGVCLTVAQPDANGNIEFYVEKNSREFDAEVHYRVKTNSGTVTRDCATDCNDILAGKEYLINIGVPNLPTTGANIFEVPAGKYSLEFTNLPEGYINPGVVTFDVADSNAIQYKTVSIKSAPKIELGDVNGSGTIDSSDASCILEFYARQSTGSTKLFTSEQESAADVNNDFRADASDASCILAYYSYISTGGTLSLKDYIKP